MTSKLLRTCSLLASFAAAFALTPAAAHDEHAHHGHTNGKPAASARVNLSETPLVDQDGRALRLKSDAIGDRIVVVSFVYTSCTTVCPVISAVLAQTQAKLGSRVGRDVGLLTVTVDPVRDTPARLKEYAHQVGAGAGWTWLTGAKPQVDEALKVFGAYTPNFLDHPPVVFVGDAKAGRWLRFYGFPSPDQLIAAIGELSAARSKTGIAG